MSSIAEKSYIENTAELPTRQAFLLGLFGVDLTPLNTHQSRGRACPSRLAMGEGEACTEGMGGRQIPWGGHWGTSQSRTGFQCSSQRNHVPCQANQPHTPTEEMKEGEVGGAEDF